MTISTAFALPARWPQHIPPDRYGGDGVSWTIDRLAESDRLALQRLYAAMLELLKVMPDDPLDTDAHLGRLLGWVELYHWNQLRRDVAAMGPDTYALFGTDPVLRQVVHDVRGGPMTSLSIDLGLLSAGRVKSVDPQRVFLLVRDVCKIIRNAFPDIDTDRVSMDRQVKAHSVQLLVEKWSRARMEPPLDIRCDFEGAIAETCIEFSALDRVLYNTMNNAIRESDPRQSVRLHLVADKAETPEHLRVMISNAIPPHQATRLTQRFGGDLEPLFNTDFSTTGSGIGLQVVGEFVARAYDLAPRTALAEKFLGAVVDNDVFHLWFHWPVVDVAKDLVR